MSAKHIATLREPVECKAEAIICKAEDEPGVYLLKTVWYDANGKREGESVEWKRMSAATLQHLLEIHYCLPSAEIERLMTA